MLAKVSSPVIRFSSKRCFSDKPFCPVDLHGKLGILGVPFGKGQNKKGKNEIGLEIAPDFLRKTGLCHHLSRVGVDVHDFGDVLYDADCSLTADNMNNLGHVAPCAKKVAIAVDEVLKGGRSCLVLGGDHSIAVGSIYAHLRVADPKKVALVYVDAHADINTNGTTPTGNIHGMTVALLARELQSCWGDSFLPGMEWLSPCLSLKNMAYIGTRSVDSGEVNYLRQNDVAMFGMDDIDKFGMEKVFCKVLSKIDPGSNKSIHVSFDIDSLDSLEAPCTSVPERAGLTLREAINLAELFYKTGRVSVFDFVELNAALGNEIQRCMTLEAAKQIILAMYGHCRKGNPKRKQNC